MFVCSEVSNIFNGSLHSDIQGDIWAGYNHIRAALIKRKNPLQIWACMLQTLQMFLVVSCVEIWHTIYDNTKLATMPHVK